MGNRIERPTGKEKTSLDRKYSVKRSFKASKVLAIIYMCLVQSQSLAVARPFCHPRGTHILSDTQFCHTHAKRQNGRIKVQEYHLTRRRFPFYPPSSHGFGVDDFDRGRVQVTRCLFLPIFLQPSKNDRPDSFIGLSLSSVMAACASTRGYGVVSLWMAGIPDH